MDSRVAEPLTAADFTPHVGTTFATDDVQTTLADVQELERHDESFRSPFTLTFRGPREPVLPQGTYAFAHEELGTVEIFVVPVASNEDGTTYEAVFN
jgi:hypothetical protein